MAGCELRRWQREALEIWEANHYRGIVGAVTGGGKTIFALACIASRRPETALIVVPTVALLDQWWAEAASFFGLVLDDIHIVTGRGRLRPGAINIGVLNTAAKLASDSRCRELMLIVDECHKAASPKFSSVLSIPASATLGLSATPERPYDDGLEQVIVPALGPVIYQYSYADALQDGVIVPFLLKNLVFNLDTETQTEYQKLTKSIARTIGKYGAESQEAISLYLRRSRILSLSPTRVEIALKLVAAHKGRRILVFHEDIEACEVMDHVMQANGVRSGVYHSKLALRLRADILKRYRAGDLDVLVTCRALDEGFNVPETEIGIIAASTATRRQRIQRLGRILRPSSDKSEAIVYTLVATEPEVSRLKEEEEELEGVARVLWGRA